MRIGELSERSGVPVATIKYYLREGLLPPGRATGRNQADYDGEHLERLRLIRALREGGDLSIATLKRVFAAMERPTGGRPEYLSIAVRSLSPDAPEPPDPTAALVVDELLERLGWDVDADSPGRADLAAAVGTLAEHLPELVERPDALVAHARAMRRLAEVEITDAYDPTADPDSALRLAVLGTVLFEPVILALRKLAHVDRQRTLARTRTPDER